MGMVCLYRVCMLSVDPMNPLSRGLSKREYWSGCMYMYAWVLSLLTWNDHKLVNWLYPNTKCSWCLKQTNKQTITMLKKKKRILEWVAISSARGSSHPRNRTCDSCVSYVGRWILYYGVPWHYNLSRLPLQLLHRTELECGVTKMNHCLPLVAAWAITISGPTVPYP